MAHRFLLITLLFVAVGSAGLFSSPHGSGHVNTQLDKESRAAFIQRAQIWTPSDIPSKDLKAGPEGRDAFPPNAMVTCDYASIESHGSSRKFGCDLGNGDVVKVRYGASNVEVQGSVLATRLLWALGFVADRVYPVRVTCRGCSSDPWHSKGRSSEQYVFSPAVIERPPLGHEMMDGSDKADWSWRELDLVDPALGGAPVEQRDALKLLAVFMQHTDTKTQQQRMVCAPEGFGPDGQCEKPFLFLHDVGLTFGHATVFNSSHASGVNYENWSTTPVWKDPVECVGELHKSHTGTLGNPRISEAGRQFLASLLVQLSDRQIQDLFEIAGVGWQLSESGEFPSHVGVANWVLTFKQKRDEIVMHHCGA